MAFQPLNISQWKTVFLEKWGDHYAWWSWESEDEKFAKVCGTEYQRRECCTERELQRSIESTFSVFCRLMINMCMWENFLRQDKWSNLKRLVQRYLVFTWGLLSSVKMVKLIILWAMGRTFKKNLAWEMENNYP